MLVSVKGFNFYTLQRQLNTTKHIFFSNFFIAKQRRNCLPKYVKLRFVEINVGVLFSVQNPFI